MPQIAHHDVSPILGILACPHCRACALAAASPAELRCRACGSSYQIDDGIPLLFREGALRDLEHLIKINVDDIPGYQGEDFYVRTGHAKHLVQAIDARDNELVLDLGCGHGHVSKWIAASARVTVVSCDILLPVLHKVENGIVVASSADDLAFGDAAFDRVVFTDVMEHIPPEMQDRVLSEIHRVLKPGGRLYVDYPGNKLPYYSGYQAINALYAVLRLFGRNVEYYSMAREPEAHVNLSFPHRINALFARHGFDGRLIPHTTKFFSIARRYRPVAELTNLFPFNHFFAQQMAGLLVKRP